MAASICTDGNEISSRPAVRSAWDVVKNQVTTAKVTSAAAGLSLIDSVLSAYGGNYYSAACYGVAGLLLLRNALSLDRKIRNTLSKIEAPTQ